MFRWVDARKNIGETVSLSLSLSLSLSHHLSALPVCAFYLVLRALDTIEDEMDTSKFEQTAALFSSWQSGGCDDDDNNNDYSDASAQSSSGPFSAEERTAAKVKALCGFHLLIVSGDERSSPRMSEGRVAELLSALSRGNVGEVSSCSNCLLLSLSLSLCALSCWSNLGWPDLSPPCPSYFCRGTRLHSSATTVQFDACVPLSRRWVLCSPILFLSLSDLSLYLFLPQPYSAVIKDICAQMGAGMAEYAGRDLRQGLEDTDDLDNCQFSHPLRVFIDVTSAPQFFAALFSFHPSNSIDHRLPHRRWTRR